MQEEDFPKEIKEMSGNSPKGITLFIVKMNSELVMECIEGMENHFDCEWIKED